MNSEGKAGEFENHRSYLEGLAYRMLGSISDAQDVVQETYLRWNRADTTSVRSARSWLTKTCSRIAMDELKSARIKRADYHGPWLPEPFLVDEKTRPDQRAQIDDSVSVALMVALETLSPSERATFLLHDVFGYNFEEVAEILGKTPAACRKLASRARSRVHANKPKFEASAEEHQRLLGSFLEAARLGDMVQLKALLSESVALHSDGGGKAIAVPKIITGIEVVALFFTRIAATAQKSNHSFETVMRWFNGGPGMLLYENGKLVTAFSLRIEEGLIHSIYALRNPDKLDLLN